VDNAALARRFFDEINGGGDTASLLAIIADDFVDHEEIPGITPDRAGVGQLFAMFRAAFPDTHWGPEDVIADGDKVVVRVRVQGTNDGPFMGMPATGRKVDVNAIEILRFEDDGLIHEHWGVLDMLALLQQLGAGPGGPA
jgi:steroid delta-isomerase-like uncharacterized protein